MALDLSVEPGCGDLHIGPARYRGKQWPKVNRIGMAKGIQTYPRSEANLSRKKQEKPTKPNANHVKETQVRATRIKCECEVWTVK